MLMLKLFVNNNNSSSRQLSTSFSKSCQLLYFASHCTACKVNQGGLLLSRVIMFCKIIGLIILLFAVGVQLFIKLKFYNHRPSVREVPGDFPIVQLDEEAIAHYHKYGYTFIRNYASAEWVEYLRDTLDDRVAHPHLFSVFTTKSRNLFKYHQMNPWMSTDGIFNFYIKGRHSLGNIAKSLANFTSLRLLHDTVDILPTFQQLPIHDDCAPLGRCAHNQMRFFLPLDYIPTGSHLNFFLNHTGRTDPAFGSVDSSWNYRLTPADEIHPGDMLMWNITTLHTAFGSERRAMTFTLMDGDAPLLKGVGQAWLSLFDTEIYRKQDSFYYPIIFPDVSKATLEARKGMTGIPSFKNIYTFLKANIKKTSSSFFFQAKKEVDYSHGVMNKVISGLYFFDDYFLTYIMED